MNQTQWLDKAGSAVSVIAGAATQNAWVVVVGVGAVVLLQVVAVLLCLLDRRSFARHTAEERKDLIDYERAKRGG